MDNRFIEEFRPYKQIFFCPHFAMVISFEDQVSIYGNPAEDGEGG